ncbi:MAG: BLUF domain-containing protein [Rhodopseudomonas sp.]|uniref:BLUF domain-containing protein n=1 Tax=Rhodopseudomonas sp. TaxID=1078 RepID=UPI0017B24747|nr:BLUF domain-containing protein [Rhodopseudomonas sp.]NVN87403.1 BLUF domain-containing protein [Rhodopseudomonas sp.]
MAIDLHRLAYVSRNRISGSADDVEQQVHAILSSSWRNNPHLGITGALIFNSGIFAQVLEGARQDIDTMFDKIRHDSRHDHVEVLAHEPTPVRTFPLWSMAFIGRSHEGRNLFGHLGEATDFESRRMRGECLFKRMRRIVIEQETRAA